MTPMTADQLIDAARKELGDSRIKSFISGVLCNPEHPFDDYKNGVPNAYTILKLSALLKGKKHQVFIPGDRLILDSGNKWPQQSIVSTVAYRASYNERLKEGETNRCWLNAEAAVLTFPQQHPFRHNVVTGEIIEIIGYGLFQVARSDFSSGDSARLIQVEE